MPLTATNLRHLRAQLIKWRQAGDSVAFVPTMGALHAGHRKLVEVAKQKARRAVVSIFLNPLQFAPTEDLSRYPRQMEADQKLLEDAGCDMLYAPDVPEIYPPGFVSHVDPGPLANVLEGAHRPGHFDGVATVVAKLLLQVLPDVALFGEKDYQQLLIIRRVTTDLDIPVRIEGLPTVRDSDGLAFSSRNVYLSADERMRAVALPQTLQNAAEQIRGGKKIDEVLKEGRVALEKTGFKLDYLALADAENLMPVSDIQKPARLLAAARIGTTRLIDNMAV